MFRSSFFYFFLSSLLLNSFFPFPFEQYLCSKDSPKDYWDIDIPHEDLYCKLDIEGSSFSSIINLTKFRAGKGDKQFKAGGR